VTLVYTETAGSHSDAARLEYRIKKMGRARKKQLAAAGTEAKE
jgi:predicted GIY-YIG superfamily endonuclease